VAPVPIQTDPLDPVYVLASAQPLLVDRALAAIRDAAVPEALRGFNVDAYDGKGVNAARVLAAARTLPMMAARRLVILRDLNAVPAAELTALAPYLEDPCPSTVLVAIAGKLDRRLKFFSAASKAGWVHELEAPRDLAGWVRAEAQARGLAVQPAACSRLADAVGADLARLALSLEQLALYAGGRAVSADDVDELIAESRERSVFELTDAIGEGNGGRARAAVAALCGQRESAVGVVVMLARHMRQLGLCHAAAAERLPKAEMARALGVPPFVVDKLLRQARRYGPAAAATALVSLAEADAALKGMAPAMKTMGRELGEQILLERLVDGIVALGG
jgi:DNA polymerase III subunit delta